MRASRFLTWAQVHALPDGSIVYLNNREGDIREAVKLDGGRFVDYWRGTSVTDLHEYTFVLVQATVHTPEEAEKLPDETILVSQRMGFISILPDEIEYPATILAMGG